MIALDVKSIWGRLGLTEDEEGDANSRITPFQLETARFAGIYGATAGCLIGSAGLEFGR